MSGPGGDQQPQLQLTQELQRPQRPKGQKFVWYTHRQGDAWWWTTPVELLGEGRQPRTISWNNGASQGVWSWEEEPINKFVLQFGGKDANKAKTHVFHGIGDNTWQLQPAVPGCSGFHTHQEGDTVLLIKVMLPQ